MVMRNLLLIVAAMAAAFQSRLPIRVASTTAPSSSLVQQGDLTYVGAFRLPVVAEAGGAGYNAGAHAMGIDTANGTLFLSLDEGLNAYNSYLGEVSIPTPLNGRDCVRNGSGGCTGTELNEATTVQSPADAWGTNLTVTCNNGASNGCIQRGIFVDGSTLYGAAYISYDGNTVGYYSHFKRPTNLSSGSVTGPIQVEAFGHDSSNNGGACGGFITNVPSAWRTALGKDTLSANWNISINSRASWGPPACLYNRADIGVASPVTASGLLFYNVTHPTLGTPQEDDALWNDMGINDAAGGAVFIEGTSTILFENAYTNRPCYGEGTTNPALDQLPNGVGDIYCYDTEQGGKGDHTSRGASWTQRIMAYDANDLAAVKAGTKQNWEVTPYAYWDFDFPQFQNIHFIKSMAYDPSTQRIYMATVYGDARGCCYNAPIIHVYHVTIH